MNVAEHLSRLDSPSAAAGIATANRIVPPIVCALLVLAIAYQLSSITLSLLPGEDYSAPAPLVSASSGGGGNTANRVANIDQLRESHLFGIAPEEPLVDTPPPVTAVDAPDTTLNLTLSGVVVRSISEDSEAMIGSGNQPDSVYRIGDAIDGGNGAELYQVHVDRVILNRSGRLETLRLPKDDDAGASVRRTAARPMPAPVQNSLAPAPLREAISQNATELTRIMRFAPHVEGGAIVGFRVTPGAESDVFAGLGLQAGDVVVDINGISLDDPSRGVEAFNALGETTMANVTVLRNGTPEVIVIDTNQINALREGRQ